MCFANFMIIFFFLSFRWFVVHCLLLWLILDSCNEWICLLIRFIFLVGHWASNVAVIASIGSIRNKNKQMWMKKMPSASRPRSSAVNSAGRPQQNTPMSERQQLALLMQMTSMAAQNQQNQNQTGVMIIQCILSVCTAFRLLLTSFDTPFFRIPDPTPSNHSSSPAPRRERNERGETPLHVAAIKGEVESVKRLLEQGANPNTRDFAGNFHFPSRANSTLS